jgi:AraC-like DNA-binding protein
MMPGIDGYEVCKQLKTDEITSHIPVILLTAKASLDSKIEGLETGADDYITKPFSEEELKLRIKNLIATREKLREKFAGQLNLNPRELSVTSADVKFLNRVKEVVEKNLINPDFNVEDFSGEVGMSRMTLHRKLKAVTGLSAKELIQEMRLRRAAQLLEKNIGTIAEVAYEVGFKEPSYFTKCFQKRFNVLPSEYVKHEISPIL